MNYVFFFPDEMRAESVSCYGHPLVKMPNFDRVAREGVRFEQCHVQHPVCSPSRCSLMTGWYPHVSGHRTLWHLLRPHEPSLFKYLKDSGYQIQWFGKNDLYSKESLDICVDEYGKNTGGHSGGDVYDFEQSGFFSFLKGAFERSAEETGDGKNVQSALDFLYSHKSEDKPFMLYLPLAMPHPVYSAPEPYHSMYDPKDIPDLRPRVEEGKPDFHSLIQEYRNIQAFTNEELKKVQAVYLGMNSCMDMMLGKILDALDETGLAENTTVIICSDHGDWAGDYGLVEKWPSALDDTITRVPLLVRMPGNKAGHVVKEQVEMFDIMPTILDISGIECKHTHFAKSFINQLNGEPGDPNRCVFAEGGYNTHEPNCFEGYPKREYETNDKNSHKHIYYPKKLQQQQNPESVCRTSMIRSLEYKLIRRTNGVSELYDLKNDPRELNNVYQNQEYIKVREDMEKKLLEWYMNTSDVVPMDEDNRGF